MNPVTIACVADAKRHVVRNRRQHNQNGETLFCGRTNTEFTDLQERGVTAGRITVDKRPVSASPKIFKPSPDNDHVGFVAKRSEQQCLLDLIERTDVDRRLIP
jgi:hypothetical protein